MARKAQKTKRAGSKKGKAHSKRESSKKRRADGKRKVVKPEQRWGNAAAFYESEKSLGTLRASKAPREVVQVCEGTTYRFSVHRERNGF